MGLGAAPTPEFATELDVPILKQNTPLSSIEGNLHFVCEVPLPVDPFVYRQHFPKLHGAREMFWWVKKHCGLQDGSVGNGTYCQA